ncbi:MAG: Aspartyl/glutamyl-tRNA(Asn/Gln) amidotransferase subunit C [Promethearchaeota archaeon]|nr:MAG: Aspartyl/glutamyl-tRNA(Asn/Gln) amidotransferase subunit C [Candidatus Lokiarchaeota archaeon]
MTEKEDFSVETIEHISKLALIDLEENEKEELAKQLKNIIHHFKTLEDLETSDVEPTRHPIEGLKNVFREDKVGTSLSNEEALKNAEHTKDGYFKAPRILKKK